MTGRERVLAALHRQPVDITPAMSITSTAVMEAMDLCGASFPAAHVDAKKMAALAAASHDIAGFDSVSPYFSIHLEASALGVEIDWYNRTGMPFVKRHVIEDLSEDLFYHKIFESKEINQLLRAIKLLRLRYGDEVAVIGKVIGPWTLLIHLYGAENLLLDSVMMPDRLSEILRDLANAPVKLAEMEFEAGADAVVWADHVTSDLISAEMYKNLLLPVHQWATGKLETMGPTILHCCGVVEDRIQLFAQTGFTCFHADSRNNTKKLLDGAGSKILLAGFVNNPIVLSQWMPASVRRNAEEIMKAGISLPAPECAIPTDVPLANLKALTDTIHRYRRFLTF